jgi:hypothetical protein
MVSVDVANIDAEWMVGENVPEIPGGAACTENWTTGPIEPLSNTVDVAVPPGPRVIEDGVAVSDPTPCGGGGGGCGGGCGSVGGGGAVTVNASVVDRSIAPAMPVTPLMVRL